MSIRLPIAVAGALLLAALASGQPRGVVGELAPDLTLPTLDGASVPLRAGPGKVVLYDFWAVWCGPCEESLPFYQELQDRYRDDGLVVIGLHVDDRVPPPEEMHDYLQRRGVRYLNLVSRADADQAFRIFAMPTSYITDRDGVIRYRHIGFNPDRTPDRLEEEVRGLLGLE